MKHMSHILLYMCIAILAVAGLVSCDVHTALSFKIKVET